MEDTRGIRWVAVLVALAFVPSAVTAADIDDGLALGLDSSASVVHQVGDPDYVEFVSNYTLEVTETIRVKLCTSAEPVEGAGIDHEVRWTLDGNALDGRGDDSTCIGETYATAPQVTPGAHALQATWNITSAGEASEDDLYVFAREVLAPDCAGGCYADASGLASFRLVIEPSDDGSGSTDNDGSSSNGNNGRGRSNDEPASEGNDDQQDDRDEQNPAAKKSKAESKDTESMRNAGVEANDETTFFVDEDGDGDADYVEDTSGRMETEHTVGDSEVFIVKDKETGNLAIFDKKTGSAAPVVPIAQADTSVKVTKTSGGSSQTSEGDDAPVESAAPVEEVAVTVPKSTGWIKVSIPDPAPGVPLSSLARSDGVVLSTDNAWRSDGQVHFVDDPDVTYIIGFTPEKTLSPLGTILVFSVIGSLILYTLVMGWVYRVREPHDKTD